MLTVHPLAQTLADLFAVLPQVEAVTLGGSQTSGGADIDSDVDVYVYTRVDIPLAERHAFMLQSGGATSADLGLTFWGPSDSWFDAATHNEIDITYFDAQWMEHQMNRVVHEHQASLGYSTCFWRTVRHSHMLYDPNGWFQTLQHQGQQTYPEPLRHNIIALNHPVLRNVIPSYMHQLEKAVRRMDRVSINHRLAGLFASYFDVIFALNRVLHPGEKRLLAYVLNECSKLPYNMAADVAAILDPTSTSDHDLLLQVALLLDRLDHLLAQEGFN